jgi:hypothetical protein
MRKLEIANAEVVQLGVQEEIGRSEEARYDHRLHGILLLCRGLSCREVAELFGCGARTVHYWVRRSEHSGQAGPTLGGMALAVPCGYPRKTRTPPSCTPARTAKWECSEPCASAMDSSLPGPNRTQYFGHYAQLLKALCIVA